MKRTLILSVFLALSSATLARAQAVGGPYLNGVGNVGGAGGASAPIDAQNNVIVTGQPPIGAPTGGAAVQGGMGSLPGTGAGATMDAYGHLATPSAGACVDCR